MSDLSSGPLEFVLAGKAYKFARIRWSMVNAALDWANDRARAGAIAGLGPDAAVEDRIKVLRAFAKHYSREDLTELFGDLSFLMHLLYLSFARENPGVSESEFEDMLTVEDGAFIEAMTDLLTGFEPNEGDPGNPMSPQGAETTTEPAGNES